MVYVLRMDGTPYLAVANYQGSVSHNTDSKIYKWDGSSFTEFQTLATNGAWWWEAFTINGIQYLAVANSRSDTSVNIASKIYRFDSSSFSFVEFQSLATSEAIELEAFTIDGAHYLAVANSANDISSFNIGSKI